VNIQLYGCQSTAISQPSALNSAVSVQLMNHPLAQKPAVSLVVNSSLIAGQHLNCQLLAKRPSFSLISILQLDSRHLAFTSLTDSNTFTRWPTFSLTYILHLNRWPLARWPALSQSAFGQRSAASFQLASSLTTGLTASNQPDGKTSASL